MAGGHYTRTTRTEEYERQLVTVTAPDKLDGTLAADIENSKGERCKRRLSLELFPVNIFCRNFVFSLQTTLTSWRRQCEPIAPKSRAATAAASATRFAAT